MRENDPLSLAVPLAIRTLLDRVSYGNALPEWFETLTIDYSQREETIRQTIRSYLNGVQPEAPFEIGIPKRSGKSNVWVIPSINDQIICQACVSSMAEQIQERCIDERKVFSYRVNIDPDRLTFVEDQIKAWKSFQLETQARCTGEQCILQFDIKDSSLSIDRKRFAAFLDRVYPSGEERRVLEILLERFSANNDGLPFLNDTVFFLGNAYLSEVDSIVLRHTPNFIRFCDDYRLFASSQSQLELLLKGISVELKKLGFDLNDTKLKLNSGQEYLEAVSKLTYAEVGKNEYRPAVIEEGVFQVDDFRDQLIRSIDKPDDFLHQGFGRLQMGSLRWLRFRALFDEKRGMYETARNELSSALSKDSTFVTKLCNLLDEFSKDESNLWRLLWLLYLSKDLPSSAVSDKAASARLTRIVDSIHASPKMKPVARLWASKMPEFPQLPTSTSPDREIENLHRVDYLERGRRCYGT